MKYLRLLSLYVYLYLELILAWLSLTKTTVEVKMLRFIYNIKE